jgi:hypothetical protein
MLPGRRQLFIYYILERADSADALSAVQRAQAALRDHHPQLLPRLFTRTPDDPQAPLTVMETYAIDLQHSPGGVDTLLQQGIDQAVSSALTPWVEASSRHLEVFDELPCAS